MPTIDVVVESDVVLSTRARQVCGMFDCPPQAKQRLEWKADLPIEARDWNIGLIVGPSGCGKTTIARHLWPAELAWTPKWDGATLIDSFSGGVDSVATALNSVGFSTIPAWLRPFDVLSNGEKFRAEIARRMLEQSGVIVIDEFTSVVDRQVAKIASHAVQKYVRRENRQLVAVTCHHDVIDWLQPDWVFEPTVRTFAWRSLQRRPTLDIEMARLPYEAWRMFAPYHYMSAELNKAAACFGLWCNGTLAAFTGILHLPHPKRRDIKKISRTVTLPDFQGLGLSFVLNDTLGAAYKALGFELRNYPAHPAFVRAHKPPRWRLMKRAGTWQSRQSRQSRQSTMVGRVSSQRPCAVFAYAGPAMESREAAERLINGRAE